MWTGSFIIGTIVLVITLVVCVVVIIVTFKRHNGDMFVSLVPAGIAAIVAIIVVGGAAFIYYPYSAEYHQWRPYSGTVTDVSSRILSTDSSVEQKFVVLIDDQEYGCTDTRCALIKKGDIVSLSCKGVWVFGGTDGKDCNFVSRKAA